MAGGLTVAVRLHGSLQQLAPGGRLEIELDEPATVAAAVQALGLRSGEVWLTMLDGRLVGGDHRLRPGDELSLIPPVGGG